ARCKTFAEDTEGQSYTEERHQIEGCGRDHDVNGIERPEKEHHRNAIEKDRQVSEGCPLQERKVGESAETLRLAQKEHRQAVGSCGQITEEENFEPREAIEQPLGVDVVKSRPETACDDQKVSGDFMGVYAEAGSAMQRRQQKDSGKSEQQSTDAKRGQALAQQPDGYQCSKDGNQQAEDGSVGGSGPAYAERHADLRHELAEDAGKKEFAAQSPCGFELLHDLATQTQNDESRKS